MRVVGRLPVAACLALLPGLVLPPELAARVLLPTQSAPGAVVFLPGALPEGWLGELYWASLCAPPPALPSQQPPGATAGATCGGPGTVMPKGGQPPYFFQLVLGALPSGLRLDANTGAIKGVPTATGVTAVTVCAIDQANAYQCQNLGITINRRVPVRPVQPTPAQPSGPTGTKGGEQKDGGHKGGGHKGLLIGLGVAAAAAAGVGIAVAAGGQASSSVTPTTSTGSGATVRFVASNPSPGSTLTGCSSSSCLLQVRFHIEADSPVSRVYVVFHTPGAPTSVCGNDFAFINNQTSFDIGLNVRDFASGPGDCGSFPVDITTMEVDVAKNDGQFIQNFAVTYHLQ